MQPIIVRTLANEIRIWPNNEAAARVFAFARASPSMAEPSADLLDIAIEGIGPFYRMALPDHRVVEGSLEHLLSEFHQFLGGQLEREAGRYPILHAASVLRGDVRALIVGGKGNGKTTLALRMLAEGFEVEGDEHVAIRDGTVLVRPRTLRVKQPSLPLLGDMAAAIEASPAIEDWHDRLIYSVEPSAWGKPWRIAAGPAHLVIFLEANHGGSSILTDIGRDTAFQRLMDASYLPAEAAGGALALLRTAAVKARCVKLQLGDLDRALWHLQRVFSAFKVS